ncbi:MAG: hypothetical protein QXO00_07020, partial [Candidatus Bathyarchaeia archaeon]
MALGRKVSAHLFLYSFTKGKKVATPKGLLDFNGANTYRIFTPISLSLERTVLWDTPRIFPML